MTREAKYIKMKTFNKNVVILKSNIVHFISIGNIIFCCETGNNPVTMKM